MAKKLDVYDDKYFSELAKEAGEKTVVLLIDDVHSNKESATWNILLKGQKPANLLVLGVGIPRLYGYTPQFSVEYPEKDKLFPLFFTLDDLPEVCALLETTTKILPREVISSVCKRALEFTAGHCFPFVTFVQHLLDPSNKVNLTDLDAYLASKEFMCSAPYLQVYRRCFDYFGGSILNSAARVLMNRRVDDGDIPKLEKMGIWCQGRSFKGSFISPLVISQIFSMITISPPTKDEMILADEEKVPFAQQIICAGLRAMTEEDFKDAFYDAVAVENAVGFRWGFNVRSVLRNVWVAPQVRTAYAEHSKPGAKPVIDFIFNGRLNLGIKLALNLKADGIQEHLTRFDGNYKRFKTHGLIKGTLIPRKRVLSSICKHRTIVWRPRIVFTLS
jgi:hypothetical protein